MPGPGQLSTGWSLFLLATVGASTSLIWSVVRGNGDSEPLVASLGFSGIAFAAAYALICWSGEAFKKAGLKGVDISKPDRRELPETMGAVCAAVYVMAMIMFIPLPFYEYLVADRIKHSAAEPVTVEEVETGRMLHRFPHDKLAEYLSAVLSLLCMAVLGIADDVFDIRWRHKLFLPAIAAIPMLVVYYVSYGVTNIVVPLFLQPYLGELIDLSWAYYLYMAAIAIFCPNSINILAGINGLEVSQSIVIALFIILNDMLYIRVPQHPATDSHLFSLYFLLPFLGVSLALWLHNRYPSRVFVGDTYCYFAGMTFAVVGILGHFSKTLLLLFVPQIFNFVYSAPQLFRLVPCPRHRLPRFNRSSGRMECSRAQFMTPPPWHVDLLLKTLERLRLVRLWTADDGTILETSNLTLINLWIVWRGEMREDRITWGLVGLQVLCGAVGLLVRHKAALLVFPHDNLKVQWGSAPEGMV